ncbi:NRDE family protein [Psychrobacter phenylpyruvicus]|nr:NRDE family protein [Psychrobacter phenylpyruvicus]
MGIKSLQAPDEQLPDTGMPPALEQALSSICIDTPEMPNYGTRTQSVLTLTKDKT